MRVIWGIRRYLGICVWGWGLGEKLGGGGLLRYVLISVPFFFKFLFFFLWSSRRRRRGHRVGGWVLVFGRGENQKEDEGKDRIGKERKQLCEREFEEGNLGLQADGRENLRLSKSALAPKKNQSRIHLLLSSFLHDFQEKNNTWLISLTPICIYRK